ncbi:Ribonuclease 1, partial [Cucurbita argyrosperma subsp. argyrosperma]
MSQRHTRAAIIDLLLFFLLFSTLYLILVVIVQSSTFDDSLQTNTILTVAAAPATAPAHLQFHSWESHKEWPSLEEEENEKIWKKEWERHGICSEPLLTQHAFFETALKLKQTYDLFNILANRAIFPFGEVYGLENISDAIKAATGHTPQVECKSYKRIPLLSNIFLCFQYTAASSIHIVDCPLVTRCKFQAVLFPYDIFGPSYNFKSTTLNNPH